MRYLLCFVLIGILFSCTQPKPKEIHKAFVNVEITELYKDSLSIRAIETTPDGGLWFASDKGIVGKYTLDKGIKTMEINYDTILPNFRSLAHNGTDAFALSIVNPALLYKLTPQPALVYTEVHENVFYDAIEFWDANEGIAMGDPTDDCLSVIITRDGGNHWEKLSCDVFPKSFEGEAAFAASDTNIAIVGEHTWIVSGGKKSRVFYSPDRGKTWEVFQSPILQGIETQGAYSVDFYDEDHGFMIGGDYTKPQANKANKAVTNDGGKSWSLTADGTGPGYKSCVQYVPNSNAEAIVAVGFTGISYSNDKGENWRNLSDEGFYTIRFFNDSIAYAAGRNRISKLTFKTK